MSQICKQLVLAVQRLAGRPRYDQKNFTINHLVDIWRGSKNAKVKNSGWDTDHIYSKGAEFPTSEANR